MKVYHGGFLAVPEPRILSPSHSMDFGSGFYTTTDFDQAKKWSLVNVVSVFEMDNILAVPEV